MKNIRVIGAIWGIFGITLFLCSAIFRMVPRVFDAFDFGLSTLQWLVLVIWCVFMLVSEGYRGFQKFFSPRVAARTWHLINHGRIVDLVFAPLYCFGFFGSTKRLKIVNWVLSLGVALLVVIVHYLPQPWRGIVDSGVVLGLSYGLVFIYVFLIKTIKIRDYIVDPNVE